MTAMNDFNGPIIEEFRANAGVVGGPFKDSNLLLLGTVGAKTGQQRTNPLVYLNDGERLVIIASFAGAAKNPPWFHNLVANPEVTVEVGAEKYQATAVVVQEPERSELYARVESAMPVFAEYQSKTERKIPVVALTRI